MEIEVLVPELGESITEATVSAWLKNAGEAVADGDILVELETDKVMVEVPAVKPGVLAAVLKKEGDRVVVGETLCKIDTDGKGAPSQATAPAAAAPATAAPATAAPATAAPAPAPTPAPPPAPPPPPHP
ncbi:MAG: biotin/lipoyl-containing protein, partial [bacterium]